jgi:hypothetical protein
VNVIDRGAETFKNLDGITLILNEFGWGFLENICNQDSLSLDSSKPKLKS